MMMSLVMIVSIIYFVLATVFARFKTAFRSRNELVFKKKALYFLTHSRDQRPPFPGILHRHGVKNVWTLDYHMNKAQWPFALALFAKRPIRRTVTGMEVHHIRTMQRGLHMPSCHMYCAPNVNVHGTVKSEISVPCFPSLAGVLLFNHGCYAVLLNSFSTVWRLCSFFALLPQTC